MVKDELTTCSVWIIAVDTDLQSLAAESFPPTLGFNLVWYGSHHLKVFLVLVMLPLEPSIGLHKLTPTNREVEGGQQRLHLAT